MSDAFEQTRAECNRQTAILLKAIENAVHEAGKQFECPQINAIASALIQFEAEMVNAVPGGSERRALRMAMKKMRRHALRTVPGSGTARVVTVGGPETRH